MLLPKAEVQAHPKDHYESTPLLLAAGVGHSYLVKLLLAKNDVNVSAIDNGEDKPMTCVDLGRKRIAMTRRMMLKLLEWNDWGTALSTLSCGFESLQMSNMRSHSA